jgi:isoleucyl-tRNA synthetase
MAEKGDYRATLNLPRTEFPMKADLVRREPARLKKWDDEGLYRRLRERRKDARRFVFHDGPPFANGNSHMGHLLNNVLKDAVVRYKFLRGFDTPFVPGWDCHGQAIEHQYLKTSGLSPRDLDPLELRKACRDYAMKWVNIQKGQRRRTGLLGDWDRPYLTMDRAMVAAELECAGQLIRDGYIFRGKKPVYWCATCETAQAENSVEYGPHESPSVWVRFPIRRLPEGLAGLAAKLDRPAFAVIWTTTPWTLPANVAVAFHPRFRYSFVRTGGEVLLMAEDLSAGTLKLAGLPEGTIVATVEGRELEGLVCGHPFVRRDSVGVLADYVTLDAGTGIVHTAPGHGLEDYATGVAYRLPVLAPIDSRGRFTDEYPDMKGVGVFEANPRIVEMMRERGILLHSEKVEHSYPHCWRCKKPVVFRATEQWFISLEHRGLKVRAAEAARVVTWHPGTGAERMGKMIDSRPDWCISRQRSWGVPIPVFYCEACGAVLATAESLKAVRDRVAEEGPDAWWIRDAAAILPADTRCGSCGGRKFRKETDTLDPWFDSGCTHTTVAKADPELGWPVDLYLEATDQFRGWFQSSLLTSMALNGAPPYREVVVHGWVLDPVGEKMSKSLGNVVSLEDGIGRWGADIMRVWGLSEKFHDDMRLSAESMDRIVDAYRKVRNTLRFLLGNLADYRAGGPAGEKAVDRWMRARLGALVGEVTQMMDAYEFYQAFGLMYRFCVVDLSAVYLDLLKDRLYASGSDDPGRRAAQGVLADCFGALTRMLTPFIPFTTEEAWEFAPESLKAGAEFAQLSDWPVASPGDAQAAADWERYMALREAALKVVEAARQGGAVETQLGTKLVFEAEGDWLEWLKPFSADLPELLVVSQAELKPWAGGGEAAIATNKGRLAISAGRAEGVKCSRCWLVRTTVGQDKEHPALCDRCASVVRSI